MTEVILGDWGTSRLRLYRCREGTGDSPNVVATAEGPGIKFAGADFACAFRDCAAQLGPGAGALPALLCGMAGSNIGWRETPYVPCTADWRQYAASGVGFESGHSRITILPGMSGSLDDAYPDIMRGEEVQLLGAIERGDLSGSSQLVCLPGTHTKWALVENGGIRGFATSVTGELFAVLRKHSVLVSSTLTGEAQPSGDSDAFAAAVALLAATPDLPVLQALFSARSQAVLGALDRMHAASWLSGLLVAGDVRDVGLRLLRRFGPATHVAIIGEPSLADRYGDVLRAFKVPTILLDARECTIRGLSACQRLRTGERSR